MTIVCHLEEVPLTLWFHKTLEKPFEGRGSARKSVTRCGIGGSRSEVIGENRAN